MSHYPLDEDGNLIDHVPGLLYYRNFLSPSEQAELLALIDSNPWQEGVIARRQQFYGEVYYHTSFKSKVLQGCTVGNDNKGSDENNNNGNNEGVLGESEIFNGDANDESDVGEKLSRAPIHDDSTSQNRESGIGIPIDGSGMRKWLDKTMPLFEEEGLMEAPSQVLINEYKNNMGIASHFEDFDAFGPVILTVSLVSPVYMTLKKPAKLPDREESNINACDTYDDIVKVLLEPGSLLVMKGDARYKYRHGIGKYKWVNLPREATATDETETTPRRIKRDDSYRRVSVTVRHLLSTRRKVREHEDESDTIKDPSVY